jgi:tRNA splicing endonuclease
MKDNDGIEQQEAAVKVSSRQESAVEDQVMCEITVTNENRASHESSADVLLEDKAQNKNAKKVSDINSTVEKNNEINTNRTVEIPNNSDGSSVKNTHDIVNTDEIITFDSAEEDNGNRVVKNPAPINSENEQEGTGQCNNFNNANEQSRIAEKECQNSKGNDTIFTPKNHRAEESSAEEYNDSSDDRSGGRMFLVLSDSDSDYEGYLNNVCPRLEKEQFPIHETLHLTLEEAFFLSFGLGCLQVIDLFGNCLPLDGMWKLFCKSQKDFIQKYVTYHYFRSKGWVVKPGIKFGGDFCKLNFYMNFFDFM